MDIATLELNNLDNIIEATPLVDLNKQQVYELQSSLSFLGYKVGSLDGVLGDKTIKSFKQFKKDTFQSDPDLIGKGSIDIIIKQLDDKQDAIEYEEAHPKQSSTNSVLNPKDSNKIDWTDFNEPISKYFTVGEFLRFDKRRIPDSKAVKDNIIKLAAELDKIRVAWGGPIGITSGYRPPAVNRACGGARYSQHLTGNAADIYPIGGNCKDFEKWLDKYWYDALGYGSAKNFVHVDIRGGKGFNSGGSKGPRWNY